MPYSVIIYSKRRHVATITLNRPEAGNAIDRQLADEVVEACREISDDDDVHVVVVTGAGGKAFSVGGELGSGAVGVADAVAALEPPVIAAINGDALGQGLELALSCDIRLASSQACFGLPQVASGAIPSDGGTQRLPRIIGRGKALEMVLTAELITADQALDIGLVSKLVPHDGLAAVSELADRLAEKGPFALRYAKEAVAKGLDLTLDQGLRLEADLYFLLHTTEDRTEGITAFLEKRSPRFSGR